MSNHLKSTITAMLCTLGLAFQAHAQKIGEIDPSDPHFQEYSAVFEAIFADHIPPMRCQITPVSLLRSEEAASKPTVEGAKSKGHCIMDPAKHFCVEEEDDSTCFDGRIVAIANKFRFRSGKTKATVNWGFHVLPDGETLDAIAITQYRVRKDKETGHWQIVDRVYSWTMRGLSKK